MNKTISKSGLCHPICFVFLSFLTAYSNTDILLINRRYDVCKSVYFEIQFFCVFSSIESMQLYFWNCSKAKKMQKKTCGCLTTFKTNNILVVTSSLRHKLTLFCEEYFFPRRSPFQLGVVLVSLFSDSLKRQFQYKWFTLHRNSTP